MEECGVCCPAPENTSELVGEGGEYVTAEQRNKAVTALKSFHFWV